MKRVFAFLPATALLMILVGCNAGTSTGGTVAGKDAVPADGVDFKLTAKKGDVTNYDVSMKMDGKGPATGGGPSEIKVDVALKQEVKVADVVDGNYTIEVKSKDVVATGTAPIAAMMGEQLKTTVGKMTINPKGQVMKQDGSVDSAMGTGGTLYFPDKKVKIGDTWERSMPGQGGMTYQAKYKFEGTEDMGGKTYAKVSMTPSTEGVKMEGKFDYLVDMATAMVAKADGKITTSADGGTMVITVAMKKV